MFVCTLLQTVSTFKYVHKGTSYTTAEKSSFSSISSVVRLENDMVEDIFQSKFSRNI